MNTTLKIIGIAFFYVITVVLGIFLNRQGRPFGTWLLTAHKLISLAIVVVTVILIRNLYKTGAPAPLAMTFFVLALVLFLVLFISGALLSGEKESAAVILILHNIATFLAPVSAGMSLYLLLSS